MKNELFHEKVNLHCASKFKPWFYETVSLIWLAHSLISKNSFNILRYAWPQTGFLETRFVGRIRCKSAGVHTKSCLRPHKDFVRNHRLIKFSYPNKASLRISISVAKKPYLKNLCRISLGNYQNLQRNL